MSSFLRRLKYYGIGFSIGLVFVIFFFQNRGCSWLPSNRVKNSILERVLVVPDAQSELMKQKKISHKDIVAALNSGDVVFGESIKNSNPKVYLIEKDFAGKGTVSFYFTLPNESYISEVHVDKEKGTKIKSTKTGKGSILRFPNEKEMLYVDTTQLLTCQKEALGFEKASDLFEVWKKNARIDFEKSALYRSPKAEHYIEFQDKKGVWIGSRSIWYKTKINISSFDIPYKLDCK